MKKKDDGFQTDFSATRYYSYDIGAWKLIFGLSCRDIRRVGYTSGSFLGISTVLAIDSSFYIEDICDH